MAEPMQDLPPELDTPSPDDEWLEGLIEWGLSVYEQGDESPGDVGDALANLTRHSWGERADEPEVARRWTVTDDGGAEWAMRHVVRSDQALLGLAAQAQVWRDEATERLARIDAWFAHGAKRHLATRAFMEAHLVAYAIDRREADPKHAKTTVLPSGVVKTTEAKPKVAVDDDRVVVAWAEQVLGKLDTAWLDEVAPEQPRKLYVQPLRDRTEVVEVIDRAQLLLASAELVPWVREGSVPDGEDVPSDVAVGRRCPQPGDGWPTPDEAADLVARVEVLASHLEVHGPDGLPVPGTHVVPGTITAKVVPA